MTGGRDLAWRKKAVRRLGLLPGSRLLDLGTGTGDLACEALRQQPACQVIGADFTLKMMRVGQTRFSSDDGSVPAWCASDATRLPFENASFDAVISGFLVRNLGDLPASLDEQHRVLRPGGKVVILDTTPPPSNWLAPGLRIYLRAVIPALGRLVAGHPQEYIYLPASTENFLQPEQMVARLQAAGFSEIGFERMMFGTVAVHWAHK